MKKALRLTYELTEESFVSRKPGFVEAWVTIGNQKEWSLVQLRHGTVVIVGRENEFRQFSRLEVLQAKRMMRQDLGTWLQE